MSSNLRLFSCVHSLASMVVFSSFSACRSRSYNSSPKNTSSATSNSDAAKESPLVFSSIEPLKGITLNAPFAQIEANGKLPNSKEIIYQGNLLFKGEDTPVNIQVKGIGRASFCKLPTLKIESLNNEEIPFLGVKSINLTTPCFAREKETSSYSDVYEPGDVAWREWIVYRILDILELPNFRTRLADLTYVDSDNKTEKTGRFFFIEKPKSVAKRFNGTIEDAEFPGPSVMGDPIGTGLNRQEILEQGMVEIFAGNWDWCFNRKFRSPEGFTPAACKYRNAKFIYVEGQKETRIPLIHDFDLSLFARGASAKFKPFEESEIIDFPEENDNIHFRSQYSPMKRWLTKSFEKSEIILAIEHFIKVKSQVTELPNSIPLGAEGKKQIASQINQFYRIIETKQDKLLNK